MCLLVDLYMYQLMMVVQYKYCYITSHGGHCIILYHYNKLCSFRELCFNGAKLWTPVEEKIQIK